jgi:hypothetical protein
MNIEQHLEKWAKMRAYGDNKAIAQRAGVVAQSVANAWSNKKTSLKVFNAMAEFYAEREEMFREYND